MLLMMMSLQHLCRKPTQQIVRLLYSVVTAAVSRPVFSSPGSHDNISQNLAVFSSRMCHLQCARPPPLSTQPIYKQHTLMCLGQAIYDPAQSPTPHKETAAPSPLHFCCHPCPTNACREPRQCYQTRIQVGLRQNVKLCHTHLLGVLGHPLDDSCQQQF